MRPEILNIIETCNSKNINLANLNIKDDEIKEIMEKINLEKPNLEYINLDRNQLTDKGADLLAKSLEQLHHLATLSLEHNQIDKAGAIVLFGLNKHILFHGNKIKDQGVIDDIQNASKAKNNSRPV